MNLKSDILSVHHLTVRFSTSPNASPAVDNLSFTLAKGQTVGIVGESGSGKSVTALSIMRLLSDKNTLSQGEILFADKAETVNLLRLPQESMRHYRGNRMAMIFQEPMTSLNPSMRCGEQVSESIRLHLKTNASKAQKKTLDLFAETRLSDPYKIYRSYPHQISGGQKQRVMIAMAIACLPDMVIADEPTTALDVTVQQTIIALLKDLQQKYGISILFISHDLTLVKQIADDIVVMHRGQNVERQTAAALFAHPRHPYTQALLACRPPSKGRMKKLPVTADFVQPQGPFTCQWIPSRQWEEETDRLLTQEPVMRVQRLNKTYPLRRRMLGKDTYFEALKSVSFDVYAGETLGLVGESGCGKTTLGRSLLRLTEPTSGSILFEGEDICRASPAQLRRYRKQVQIIFQDPYSSLNPRQTVGNALTAPMRLHHIGASAKERKENAVRLLEEVGLNADDFNRYPHQFSGGQRQRICIARALSVDPKFIICDESVSALDVSVQAQILNLLNRLKAAFRLTFLFISHDLSVVRFMSHRIMVMKNGQLLELALADTLFERPQHPYSQQLVELAGISSQ